MVESENLTNGSKNYFKLIVLEKDMNIKIFPLDGRSFFLGRSEVNSECEIQVDCKFVSRKHGYFISNKEGYYYIDYPNLNGTYYNGDKIYKQEGMASQPIKLSDGDVLRIDSPDFGEGENEGVVIIFSTGNPDKDLWMSYDLSRMSKEVLIGRKVPEGNICIPNPIVSALHAKIVKTSQGLVVGDCKSTSGTLLNGTLLNKPVRLFEKDIINIGSSKLIYMNNFIVYNIPKTTIQQGVEIKVEHIAKDVFIGKMEKKRILDDISLSIRPGELIAIIGASGAGKTTFMNAICGFERATEGKVYINNNDLYENYEFHKTQIGYVPQSDIVHENLTVESMLKYVGKLRLPNDISNEEISYQVNSVIEIMGLTPHKDKLIRKLSGGQKKRASIAAELISDPVVLFMDEPSSGLDPEADINLVKHLKELASKEGKTIIVITHSLQNIHIFDKIIFLASGGKLAFFGEYNEALEFFDVKNLVDAYEKLTDNTQLYVEKYKAVRLKDEL